MNKVYSILVFFVFFSCSPDIKDTSNKNKVQKSNVKIITPIKYKSIFYDLSPKMSDYDFEKRIKMSPFENDKLCIPQSMNGKVKNYKDPYSELYWGLDNFDKNEKKIKTYCFTVLKKSNRIVLEYNNIKDVKGSSYSNTQDLSIGYRVYKFLEIFQKKYSSYPVNKSPIKSYRINEENLNNKLEIKQNLSRGITHEVRELPITVQCHSPRNVVTLCDFGFNQNKYSIFQDSSKTIIVGYSIFPYSDLVSTQTMEKIYKQRRTKLNNDIKKYGKSYIMEQYKLKMERDLDSDRVNTRGFIIEINYFTNEEFKILRDNIMNKKRQMIREKYVKDSLLRESNMKVLDRLNDI